MSCDPDKDNFHLNRTPSTSELGKTSNEKILSTSNTMSYIPTAVITTEDQKEQQNYTTREEYPNTETVDKDS